MNIIQSIWSCGKTNLQTHKAGWLSFEYNLMSVSLSCLQINKFYDNIILYSDDAYAKVLIDILKLPYSEVKSELDCLNEYDEKLWALPKIYTYSKQTKPFLHIDCDIFIWEKFKDEFMQKELLTQNIEISTEYYENIMKNLEENLCFFPNEIIELRKSEQRIYVYIVIEKCTT